MSGAEPAGRGTTIFTGRVGKDGPAVIADILKPVAAMPDRSARLVSMVSLAIQAVHDDAQSYVNPGLCAMTGCPLWVKSRHMQCKQACLLYPRKRTCAVQ